MSSESLINRYRPARFKDVIGQEDIVRSYKRALDDHTSHAFLFTGPPGCGKTSLSRIGAAYVGSKGANLVEMDAASHSSVDAMRAVTEALMYRPLSLDKNPTKSVIIDECHSLSGQAWQSLLKTLEEPPEWVYFFLCTTDIRKVPDTINKSRCSSYVLRPVAASLLVDYLEDIVKAEKFDTPRAVLELCARQAEGSPRRALSNLSVCFSAADRAEAARLISDLDDELGGNGYELAKALAAGWSWQKVRPILEGIVASDESPETIRKVVSAYFAKIAITAKDEKAVCGALKILDNFSTPFTGGEGFTPVVIAVGRSLFG